MSGSIGLLTFVAGSSQILSLSQSFEKSLFIVKFMLASDWLRKVLCLSKVRQSVEVYEEQPLMCLSVCNLFLIAPRRCELASQKIDCHGV